MGCAFASTKKSCPRVVAGCVWKRLVLRPCLNYLHLLYLMLRRPRRWGSQLVVDIEATSATQFLMAKTALWQAGLYKRRHRNTSTNRKTSPRIQHQQSHYHAACAAGKAKTQYPRPESQNAGVAIDAGHGGKDWRWAENAQK